MIEGERENERNNRKRKMEMKEEKTRINKLRRQKKLYRKYKMQK